MLYNSSGNFYFLQVQGVFRKKEKAQVIASAAEKRLIVILSYYILFGIISMVTTSVSTSNLSQMFFNSIASHFSCEALGYTPGKCDRGLFEQYSTSWLFTLTYIFHGLIPVVSLVFVLDTKELKRQVLWRCFHRSLGRRTTHVLYRSIHSLSADRLRTAISNPSFKLPTHS